MLNVILAVEQNNGLGLKGKLSWNISEELKIFKEKTLNSILIIGRKTAENLPFLKDRTIFIVSKSLTDVSDIKVSPIVNLFSDIEDAIENAKKLSKINGQKIFIIGGNQIYNYVFKYHSKDILVHISFIKNKYHCDTYFDINNLNSFSIVSKKDYDEFTHYELKYFEHGEQQYLNIIKDIIQNGETKIGRNGSTISDFCKHLKFDLRDGFPLLTTKKMFLKGIIEELLFFIRGETDSKVLEEKGINIWKGNTNRDFLDKNGFNKRKEGEMGPMYGYQWRKFNRMEKTFIELSEESFDIVDCYIETKGIDQLKNVINEIKMNPTSRRILLTTYNPSQVHLGVLYPCHSITIQFNVQNEYLDMFCYNRSSDIGLGLPFNIASSSLFLMIIAKLTNLTPRYFNLTLGDAHIYSNHIDALKEQIKRRPYIFPTIELPDFTSLEDVEKLTCKDFIISNYNYYDTIKMDMVA